MILKEVLKKCVSSDIEAICTNFSRVSSLPQGFELVKKSALAD